MFGRTSLLPMLIVAVVVGVALYGKFSEPDRPDRRQQWRPEWRRPPPPPDRIGDRRRPPALPGDAGEERRSPDDLQPWRPGPGRGRPLPPPSRTDQAILIRIPAEKRSSSGTAFAIDDRGTWMTARHVVDSCARVYVLTAPRRGLRVRSVYIHRSADIAILRTERGAPAMHFSTLALSLGQNGYHFGFPKGRPGSVSSRLIGRRVMRVTGRYHTSEPVVAWAERRRIPDTFESLGGISGGPALDSSGNVIGVTVAGSRRRGRVFTTAPISMQRALARAGVNPMKATTGRRAVLDPGDFADHGARLRRRLTVAKVVCLAPGRRQYNPRRPQPGAGGGPRY